MTSPTQRQAVVQALGMTPADLRSLADVIEALGPTVLVRQVADAAMASLPPGHLYLTSLRRLAAWAGEEDAEALRPSVIADLARRAGEEALRRPNALHGLGAQEAFVLAARSAYGRAVDAGLVTSNPAAVVALPARPPGRRTALSRQQLEDAHHALVGASRDPGLDDLVFQFLRETACRRGGAIGLRRADIAPATRTARVVEKYGKERRQPISAHLADRLLRHAEASTCRCERAFHRRDGGHLTDRWFDGFARRIQRLPWADELGVTAHWLRHTTLTDIERLAGIRVAAAYAGHSDSALGVTGRYTKVAPDELRDVHDRLFFDESDCADDASAAPQIFRRVALAATGAVEFASGDRAAAD